MKFITVPNQYDVMTKKLHTFIKILTPIVVVLFLIVLAYRITPVSEASIQRDIVLQVYSMDDRTPEQVDADLAYREENALQLALDESILTARLNSTYSHLSPPKDTALVMEQAAQKHNVDAKLLMSICVVESQLRPDVKSHAGAIGMCQIIPKWHSTTADAMYDYRQNIDKSAEHIALLLKSCNRDLSCVMQSYNVGYYGYKAGTRNPRYQAKVEAEYRRQ